MSDNNCIRCNKEVRARQHGIQCDTCHLWQHRTCGTGITLEQYRQAVRGDMQLQWRCIPCVDASGIQANDDSANITMGLATPVAESTRLALPGIFHGNMQSFEQDMQVYQATSSDDPSDDSSAVSSDDSSAVSSDDDSSDDDSSDDSSAISSDDDDGSGSSDDDSSADDSSNDGVGSHASLMRSINPDRVSFQQPEPMEESSIVEEERLEVSVRHEGVRTYQIVPDSSQRQKDKLIDNDGYTYNVKSKSVQFIKNTQTVKLLSLREMAPTKRGCTNTSTLESRVPQQFTRFVPWSREKQQMTTSSLLQPLQRRYYMQS